MSKISDLFKKKEHLICRPCAELLKEQGKLHIGISMKEKATCEIYRNFDERKGYV